MSTAETSEERSAAALRVERRAVDKFALRRADLAEAALLTLGELGYARTTLREIAQKSAFSHGVLHYYFADKVDLITYCVREYKARCVAKYDQITATESSAEGLRRAFAAALAASARDDTAMHRLWYDLRNQSLFDDAFRAEVEQIDRSLEQMIHRIVTAYAGFVGTEVALGSAAVYGLVDGLFHRALVLLSRGDGDAPVALQEQVWQLLPRLLSGFGTDLVAVPADR